MLRTKVMVGLSAGAIGACCLSALLIAAPSDSPVADAAMHDKRDEVRTLLKQGADVNAAQGDGLTALHWAALKGDVELAQMLVYAGANLKATTRLDAFTPLLMAAKDGDAAMVEALVTAGADTNAATTNGTTPLMFASASGSVKAVETLLSHGAKVNATEHAREETPLIFAAASGRTDVIRALVAHGADVKATTKVVDSSAYSKEELERFAAFAATGAPPNSGVRQGEPAAPAAAAAREAAPKPEGAPKPEANAEEGKEPANQPNAARANQARGPQAAAGRGGRGGPPRKALVAGVSRQYLYNELVGKMGGISPLLIAARQGDLDSVKALLDAGADVNAVSAGDHTSPLLISIINGRYDLAKFLLDKGANPKLAQRQRRHAALRGRSTASGRPRRSIRSPAPTSSSRSTYLDLMTALLDKGADPNVRLARKVWYSGYNFDLSGVDETGATPFWRAAYAADVDAMKLLVAHGADINIPTMRTPGRPRTGDGQRDAKDVSGLPPVPVGGPGVPPLLAAAGVGYGEGFAANSHRSAPGGMLNAVKYLVEVLHVDVNARDHDGNTALHDAAARGDNEMILYLVSKGADVKAVSREGKTVADMANGPVQRVNPFPETLALLEKLGSKNNHKCVSC